jgi:Transposase, Mutator family
MVVEELRELITDAALGAATDSKPWSSWSCRLWLDSAEGRPGYGRGVCAFAKCACASEMAPPGVELRSRPRRVRSSHPDTRYSLELAVPKLRAGSYFPDWLLQPRRRAEQAFVSVIADARGLDHRAPPRLSLTGLREDDAVVSYRGRLAPAVAASLASPTSSEPATELTITLEHHEPRRYSPANKRPKGANQQELREASDGLEPSTPSLPGNFSRNRSQRTATVLACAGRFGRDLICR